MTSRVTKEIVGVSTGRADHHGASYILILTPHGQHGWPAVVGGYGTREAAEAAGREATMAHLTQDGFERAGYGFGDWPTWEPWLKRPWSALTVIPGNAAG